MARDKKTCIHTKTHIFAYLIPETQYLGPKLDKISREMLIEKFRSTNSIFYIRLSMTSAIFLFSFIAPVISRLNNRTDYAYENRTKSHDPLELLFWCTLIKNLNNNSNPRLTAGKICLELTRLQLLPDLLLRLKGSRQGTEPRDPDCWVFFHHYNVLHFFSYFEIQIWVKFRFFNSLLISSSICTKNFCKLLLFCAVLRIKTDRTHRSIKDPLIVDLFLNSWRCLVSLFKNDLDDD